jgi:DNA polymerase (family X)
MPKQIPPAIDGKAVAQALRELATLLEITGANTFKVRAHENAARAIDSGEFDVVEEAREGTLGKRKGFGEGLVKKITELVETGAIGELETLRAEVPEGLLDMLRIPGFGPKKIKAVWKELGITSLEALHHACEEHRLADLSGFGAKTEAKILEGIKFLHSHAGLTLWSTAWSKAQAIVKSLRRLNAVERIEVAGSLRRRREVVKDIDIVCSSLHPIEVMDAFVALEGVDEIVAKGETKTTVRLSRGISCDLRVVTDEQFPFTLAHFTGSKEHNVAMRGRAQREFSIRVSEYGLFDESRDGELIPCADEEALHRRLGLGPIAPEMREDLGEIAAAEAGELPNLVTEQDIVGNLHMHTVFSDGKESIERMARACAKRGFQWAGISDHSVTAAYAGGMTPERVLEQFEQIDALNARGVGCHLFKGIEVDILSDGSIDYDEEIWERSDFLIASVHSQFTMGEAEMTERIRRAMENPFVTILGHPTGRLLLSREPYAVDLGAVIDAAAHTGTMIEINANPLRLDLDWRWVRRARDAGVMIAIGPDAHSVPMLDDIWIGVGIARKGWLRRGDVLNCLSIKKTAATFALGRKT